MKAILSQAAMNVAHAAANNSRGKKSILSNVRIGDGEVVASDGYILARCPVETVPENGDVILVEASEIIKARKESGVEQLVIETVNGTEVMISNPETKYLRHIKLIEAAYPSIDQILPQEKSKAYVALGIGLLTKMLKIADVEHSFYVKVKVRNETDPVEVISHETKIYVMPMAINEGEDV